MSKRLTPDTDAVAAYEGNWDTKALRMTAHSRKLERERDEAREEINSIRIKLSKNGEAVGSVEHDFSIIEMVENLMQSKDYFVRKSDSLERERDEARGIAQQLIHIASHCLGWHDHKSSDTAIKIAAALKRWKKSKIPNEQD